MGTRRRLDAELVRRGLARSREQAADLVTDRRVLVAGQAAAKPATQVAPDDPITVTEPAGPQYASRGGWTLAGALAAFPGLQVAGRRCLDAGASTGGHGTWPAEFTGSGGHAGAGRADWLGGDHGHATAGRTGWLTGRPALACARAALDRRHPGG